MRLICFILSFFSLLYLNAQNMTPDLLWKLGRVSPIGISEENSTLYFKVTTYDVINNKRSSVTNLLNLKDGSVAVHKADIIGLKDRNLSPDGKYLLYTEEAKLKNVEGKDLYPEFSQSNAYVFDNLHYRHWDHWEDGKYSHLFVKKSNTATGKDIMEGEAFDCPQKPFGGDEDYIWSPDSKRILYVSKKKFGTDYARSTNTDIYSYDLESGKTLNLTEGMMGYDTHPDFAPDGTFSWLSMKRDGYEADKNDIYIERNGKKVNLTADWDGTVESYKWSPDSKKIYFTAAVKGTKHVFELILPVSDKNKAKIRQLSQGDFDINNIIGFFENKLIVMRNDFNHASEIYSLDLTNGKMQQLTHVNDEIYSKVGQSKTEKRWMKTADGKDLMTWVIYPPNFDPNKKYPALLYCQGGPQSALTQFYSFRWNLHLMASQGYIVVAPNRRGMPGHGVEWNEAISKDWGGKCMDDYLLAIDEVSKEKFVDKSRIACVGASFGGYSAFYLAGKHAGRFKSFIAHCGIFNLESMYGTTEEIFFTHWDMGAAYWDKENPIAKKTFNDFNPINFVDKWDAPIMIIHGGKDYRVPYSQGMEAFQAAQLRGIKSRFLYLPDENHWVMNPQNAMVWQKEFFRWLKETL